MLLGIRLKMHGNHQGALGILIPLTPAGVTRSLSANLCWMEEIRLVPGR
jgi:hypothetical protein